jgi:hypothetical protein
MIAHGAESTVWSLAGKLTSCFVKKDRLPPFMSNPGMSFLNNKLFSQ